MGNKVLIIDDDPDLVEAVSMLLEAEGLSPLGAYGGNEGLAMAKSENPDLIVLDVMMPDMDGFQVGKELLTDNVLRNIPLIMLSAVAEHVGDTNYKPHADAKALEADDWFDKPVDPHALVKRIKQLID